MSLEEILGVTGMSVAFLSFLGAIIWREASRKDRGLLPEFKPDKSYIPILLFVDDSLTEEYPQIVDAIEGAINFMNEASGLELFIRPDDFSVSTGEIVPVMRWDLNSCEEGNCHKKAFAFTKFDHTGKPEVVYIVADRIEELDDTELKFGVSHELGHVVGLAHDDFTNSFMYYKVLPKDPEMTVKDKELLHELYGVDSGSSTT